MLFNPLKVEELDKFRSKAEIKYYVNATTGSDDNDGLTANTAFKTIQHAIDILPKWLDHNVTIYLAAGTHSAVTISGFGGKGHITIEGAPYGSADRYEAAVNYVVEGITVRDCVGSHSLAGVTVKWAEGRTAALHVHRGAQAGLTFCRFSGTATNASGQTCIRADTGGKITLEIYGLFNAENGIVANSCGHVFAQNVKGSGITNVYVADCGIIQEGNNVYVSGTTKYTRKNGGLIVKTDGSLA